MDYRIGVDLGGTKIEVIALDDTHSELYRQREATPQGNYAATIAAVAQLIQDTQNRLKRPACSIGIGIPGSISPATGLIKNANSTCLIGNRLDQDLAALLKRPVRIANDADCFTLSEAVDGNAAGAKNVFGVILGTGVGGGIVINQKLLSGPNAICGEWGHNPLPWLTTEDRAGRSCYCGKRDCIETFLSGPGFARAFKQNSASLLSSEQIWQLAATGDPAAKKHCDLYLEQLARALATVINILDPEVIVLGGGLSNQEEIYQQVPQRLDRYVFSDRVDTQLCKAKHGDSSGVRGAAWL